MHKPYYRIFVIDSKKEIIFPKDSGNSKMILQATISHLPRAGQLFPWGARAGWWSHGQGATQAPKMPHGQGTAAAWQKLWMVPNQASSNDCNDPSAFVSKLLVKGGRCLQPCLKWKDAERFRRHKTIQWPRDKTRFLSQLYVLTALLSRDQPQL